MCGCTKCICFKEKDTSRPSKTGKYSESVCLTKAIHKVSLVYKMFKLFSCNIEKTFKNKTRKEKIVTQALVRRLSDCQISYSCLPIFYK